jgi:molybdopterin converting factor small subunit
MSAKVMMHPIFTEYVGGHQTIEVAGKDVGECLAALIRLYPALEKNLFDKNGTLRGYLKIYVNGKSAIPPEFSQPIADGDEIRIMAFGAGG